MITVRANGVVEAVGPTASSMPDGTEVKLRVTVFGSSLTDVEALRPLESVAVNVSRRYDGYSWSGAENDPLATPSNVWSGCVWQFDGQCQMSTDQCSAEGGSVPSSASVAPPENAIGSPTFQVVELVGRLIAGAGGVPLDATCTPATSDAPAASATRTRTFQTPAANDLLTTAPVASPNAPSLLRSHEYVSVSPASGSVDAEASRRTASGAGPEVGEADTRATGALSAPRNLMR